MGVCVVLLMGCGGVYVSSTSDVRSRGWERTQNSVSRGMKNLFAAKKWKQRERVEGMEIKIYAGCCFASVAACLHIGYEFSDHERASCEYAHGSILARTPIQ